MALKYIIGNIRFIFSNYSIIPYKKLFYKSFIYLFLCYVKGIGGFFIDIYSISYIFFIKKGALLIFLFIFYLDVCLYNL